MSRKIVEDGIMNIGAMVITLFLFAVINSMGSVQPKTSHGREQLHFSAEDLSVKKPVPVPKDVLAVLMNDKLVRSALENEDPPVEKVPLSWFSASTVHLSNPDKGDLVVMAVESLHGSNVTTFWVFRMTDRGYDLVLKAPAHDLIVMDTHWKSYRDIELISGSASQVSSVVCRFNGQRYEGHRTKTESH
jgi:hypothetical protein